MRYRKKNPIGHYFRFKKTYKPVVDEITGKIFMNIEIESNHKLKNKTFVFTPNQLTILLNTLLLFHRDNPNQINLELMDEEI